MLKKKIRFLFLKIKYFFIDDNKITSSTSFNIKISDIHHYGLDHLVLLFMI
jgi:hypothetical protein